MAAPADPTPSSADQNPQTPAVEQTTVDDRRGSKVEVVKESYPSSVFVNSEPIREEQVQNAVKFLSHPKVRGSPVIHRRSFLERKGLTKEEIDEAFRRLPDPTPSVQTTEPVVTNQDGKIKSSADVQTQAPTQVVQSNPVLPGGNTLKLETDSRFHWSYAILAVGFLAVSGAGTVVLFKNAIIPRLKSWICKVASEDEEGLLKKNNGKPSIAEEAATAAKVAAAAASDVAEASRQMLMIKSEEKKCFEELMGLLNAQVHELRSMMTAIKMLEGGRSRNGKLVVEQHDDERFLGTSSKQPYANGKTVLGSHSVRSSSRPAPADPSVAPHPKSYMEIMTMIQRGERPSNIKEINDTPPNPNQPLSNPRLAPRPKPWEVSQPQTNSTNILQTQESSKSSNYKFPSNPLSGGDAALWWQRKNVRITELEAGNEKKPGSSNVLGNEQSAKRSWVPPQPPPVVMPEAAAVIRQPKKPSYQKEQTTDNQLLAPSPDVTDELPRITRIPEAGGSTEANGKTSVLSSSDEIQAEENSRY
ncbi:peroxisomal membrane protein PEX14 isoform X1 [Sesamum indicum]|uniref:Peroxisomal membrane protein PEX14 n=1 Tax=Sesamum indicum TaxID=4182 RepID=A0A6I9V133_SESIN|nr:peroxisomal membrane protein PEX14 isoform X1 [Sesamum indicum]